jgi:hypothetical protein
MGEARTKRERVLLASPNCIYCGGAVLSTTIDHCPPRAMFQEKKAPEGYEFGSCEACNAGTSDADLMVSALARIGVHSDGNTDGRLMGLMSMANKQYPGMLNRMMPSASEARRLNRLLNLQPPPGMLHEHSGVAHVTEEHLEALRSFARKLTKAVYFKHAGKVFPNAGTIAYKHFTNADAMQGDFQFFETLEDLAGDVPKQVRTKIDLSSQFSYKVSLSDARDVIVLQAAAYKSFGLVTFSSIDPNVIQGAIGNLELTTGHSSPFEILQ